MTVRWRIRRWVAGAYAFGRGGRFGIVHARSTPAVAMACVGGWRLACSLRGELIAVLRCRFPECPSNRPPPDARSS